MRNIHLLPLSLAVILFSTVSPIARSQSPEAPEEQSASAPEEGTPHTLGGESTGYLARTLRTQAATHAAGARPMTPFVEHSLRTNERIDLEVSVEGGQCYVALAVGVPSVRELDLYVLDPFGQQRARDGTRDAAPVARFCPTVSGTWKVQLHLFNGYGRVAAQTLRLP